MAVSNSSNFTATRTQIIRAAALKVGAIGTGVAMSSQMEQDMAHELNAMVKMWHGMGIHVWTTIEATLFPQLDQIKYQLGATDHATESYVQTTISAAEAVAPCRNPGRDCLHRPVGGLGTPKGGAE